MSALNTSVVEMVKSIKKGEITSEELVKNYIKEIKKKEKIFKLGNSLMKNLHLLKQKNQICSINQENMATFMVFQSALKIFLIQKICQLDMEQKFIRKIQV